MICSIAWWSFTKLLGLNIFYLVLSVHTFIHEHILVQALGLERKQYAYRVLLPTKFLLTKVPGSKMTLGQGVLGLNHRNA